MTRKKKSTYSILRKPPHAIKDKVDFDYLHKLNDKELEWLNDFSKSFYQGCGSDKLSKGDSFTLDSTGKQTTGKRAGYGRYNASYRDAMTRFHRQPASDYIDLAEDTDTDDNNTF